MSLKEVNLDIQKGGNKKRYLRKQESLKETFENFSKTLKSRVQEDFEDDGRLQARFGRTTVYSQTPRGTCVPSPTEWLSKGHKQQPQSSVQIAAALQQCADKATWLWTQGFLLQHLLLLLLLHKEHLHKGEYFRIVQFYLEIKLINFPMKDITGDLIKVIAF